MLSYHYKNCTYEKQPYNCLYFFAFISPSSILSGQNEITIFPLTLTSQDETNMAIRAHMDTISTASDSALLAEFLTSAYSNQIYVNSPLDCSKPGINVVENNYGFFFTFSGFVPSPTQPDALYVTQMASHGPPMRSTAVQGPRVFNGYILAPQYAQHRIFLVGSYCSDCVSLFLKSCVSNWEVIIIEKSII